MHQLNFRQVHLDFHTSPAIPEVGQLFDKHEWQDRLQAAHVNSITCFSCCHHGMSYHPTKVGVQHPGLKGFNLLRAQIDACHEIGIKVPIYITAGLNDIQAQRHPEWRNVMALREDGTFEGGQFQLFPLSPGFRHLCFNTSYMDFLCKLTAEAVEMFPDADGVFFDIISQPPCCCPACIEAMYKKGYNPQSLDDRTVFARETLMEYYRRSTETVHRIAPDMPVFHNSGNVAVGDQEILPYFSHLELESLPTGGWGYDHYPMTAAYSRNLGFDFLGMTGKFHGTWGEFGGFKHPNALRYECAAMIANNSKCSIGDQLHPSGKLDKSTYDLIGQAYSEVEQKEPWCVNAVSAATTAILAGDEFIATKYRKSQDFDDSKMGNTGASRFLLECHIPFDIVDSQMDFTKYKLLVVACGNKLPQETLGKLNDFISQGGKVVMTGSSILAKGSEESNTILPVEGTVGPLSEYSPDFIQVAEELAGTIQTPFLMRQTSRRFKTTHFSLGKIYDPYFNRSLEHYCSHQMTPYHTEPTEYSAGVCGKSILYFAHPIFELYAATGMVCLKDFIRNALERFATIPVHVTGLPSTGRLTLMRQPNEKRTIVHLLYAAMASRGMRLPDNHFPNYQHAPQIVEVIEDLPEIRNVQVSLDMPQTITSVKLQPQNQPLDFNQKNGKLTLTVPAFTCHAMVEIQE